MSSNRTNNNNSNNHKKKSTLSTSTTASRMIVFALTALTMVSLLPNEDTSVSAFIPSSSRTNFASLKPYSSSSLQILKMVPAGFNNTMDGGEIGGNESSSSINVGVMEKKENIQLRASPIRKKMPHHEKGGPVEPIDCIGGFLNAIENAPPNGIVVVQYHAKWCKVCARVIVKLRQMAQRLQHKETPVPVSFASVEISANPEICSTLGIKKFPFVQMYRNSECVASFGTGPAHNFQKVVGGTLEEKLHMDLDAWEGFRSEFQKEIQDGLDHLETLRLSNFFDEQADVAEKIGGKSKGNKRRSMSRATKGNGSSSSSSDSGSTNENGRISP